MTQAEPEPTYYGAKLVLTAREVAELMGVSHQTVLNIFKKEPGTILIRRPARMHKRVYTSVRIPVPVFERVLRRLTV